MNYIFDVFQVPLEGFKALQGISGPQRFQIHKAYGPPDRLPSAHTWYVLFLLYLKLSRYLYRISFAFMRKLTCIYIFSFNQLDLPEYTSKEQLHERLLLAIHEASEGFGFG